MKKVLFVCLGNICRSPAAEGVFRKLVADHGLENEVFIDSAGTSAFHAGCPPDGRMQECAMRRGYPLRSLARQFDPEKDFEEFDYIVTMDRSNFELVSECDPERRYASKIFPMTSFCTIHEVQEVPDPYYGGVLGFETVMDIVEDACEGLLKEIR